MIDTKPMQDGAKFAAQARLRAGEMLAAARSRGERVSDEGDFMSRAIDAIYGEAREQRRARSRGRAGR